MQSAIFLIVYQVKSVLTIRNGPLFKCNLLDLLQNERFVVRHRAGGGVQMGIAIKETENERYHFILQTDDFGPSSAGHSWSEAGPRLAVSLHNPYIASETRNIVPSGQSIGTSRWWFEVKKYFGR